MNIYAEVTYISYGLCPYKCATEFTNQVTWRPASILSILRQYAFINVSSQTSIGKLVGKMIPTNKPSIPIYLC